MNNNKPKGDSKKKSPIKCKCKYPQTYWQNGNFVTGVVQISNNKKLSNLLKDWIENRELKISVGDFNTLCCILCKSKCDDRLEYESNQETETITLKYRS
jgi:hypothetical protein